MVYSKAVVPAGALSAITLKAAARSLSLSPGQTAVLDCSIERDSGELVSWYKQSPGDAPQFVLNHYHTNSSAARYGSRFSSERFTARAKDPLTYQLVISRVEKKHIDSYLCLNWYSVERLCEFAVCALKRGRRVQEQASKQSQCSIMYMIVYQFFVTPANQLPAPSVVVFPPSEEELITKGTATLVCLVRKLAGALADISWAASETAVTNEVPPSRPSRESDGTFSVSSCLTVSAAEWREDRVYSCIVQQGASLTQRSIQQSHC
ncbi:LAC protein, partial [Polyodon spathula]|nr:LAC protein [Polyodon spathula]